MFCFGVYHSDYSRPAGGVGDAPCITKGRMTLCARDAASEGGVVAMARGRLRNRRALARELGCEPDAGAARIALNAYLRWGEDFPSHMEGPVALCVMDADADILVLSRDRMGEQPLFCVRRDDWVAFSNHPDALLKSARAEPAVDADGLRELFGLGPARTPGRTPYRDIRALEPGCALIARDGKVRMDRYFRLGDRPHTQDPEQTAARVRELLEQAVAEALPLRPAVMLSGGLDSTALTALLCARQKPVRTFSVDYADNARDFRPNAFRPEIDAPYVLEAVRAFGTQHRPVTLDQASLAMGMGRAMTLRGFPGMADIDSSLMLFAGEIERFDGSVVSGECGDEVFGGYPWFRGEAMLEGFPWSGSLELREDLLLPEVREALRLREYVADVFSTRRAAADPGPDFPERERRLRTMQRLCFEFFMPNLQERAVRMCEGSGLRLLTPMCDERLAEYVYNVPWDMKFMGGQEKGLLRAAVRDLLPERLLRRTKSPYPKTCSPVFARLGRRMMGELLERKDAPLFELVDRDKVRALVLSELDPAQTPWYGQLMAGPQLLGYLWQVNRWLEDKHVAVTI